MDRETFISILTEGYQFKKLSPEKIRLIPALFLHLINESEHEIWASLLQNSEDHDDDQGVAKLLIEIDSFSLLYAHFVEDRLLFFLYDEESVSLQLQRIAFGIGFMMECIEWLETSLKQDINYDKPTQIYEPSLQCDVYDENIEVMSYNNVQSYLLRTSNISSKQPKSYKKWKQHRLYIPVTPKIYQKKSTKLSQHHIQILDSYLAKHSWFQKLRMNSKTENV